MANVAIIMGKSGTGKSTSIKSLNPDETVIISMLDKRLPFKGSKKMYNVEKKNLFFLEKHTDIINYLKNISDKATNVKNVVLDDCIYSMRKEFFGRINEKGYEIYKELAAHFQQIIATCEKMRGDINVFLLLHIEPVFNGPTIETYKIATIGKLIDEKFNPVELVSVALMSDIKYDNDGKPEYGFYTHANLNSDGIKVPAKCFAKGTLIRMSDGSTRPIEELKVGDTVLGTNGKAVEIESVHSGIDNLFKVEQANGIDYIVNSEHILVTESGEVPTKEAVGKKLKGVKSKAIYNNSKIRLPYFIGLWLGDGAKSSTSVTTMDDEVISYLKQLAKEEGLRFSTYKKESSKAYEVNLSDSRSYTKEVEKYTIDGKFIESYPSIKEAAVKNNVLATGISCCASGRSSNCGGYVWKRGSMIKYNSLRTELCNYNLIDNKHIPAEFKTASYEDRMLLLAGLIDTDGTKSDNRYLFSTAKKDVALDVKEIAESCGFDAVFNSRHNNYYDRDYYLVTISGNVQDIPVRVAHKKISKKSNNNNWLTITPIGEGEYYGFSLKGDCKTFFLSDYTVVHNSPDGMFDEDFIPNDLQLVVDKMNEYYE